MGIRRFPWGFFHPPRMPDGSPPHSLPMYMERSQPCGKSDVQWPQRTAFTGIWDKQ